jgi:hypothetical protein
MVPINRLQVDKTTEQELNICLNNEYHVLRREMSAMQDALSRS